MWQMHFSLIKLEPDHLDQIIEVQSLVYPAGYHESADVFHRKLSTSDASGHRPIAYGHRDDEYGLLASYGIAHPWISHEPPPMHSQNWALPAECDIVHLHDIAVAPTFRGRRLATALLEKIIETAIANGWRKMTLVAVRDSWPFWEGLGFTTIRPHDYVGERGFWMQRPLVPMSTAAR
jgi:GNAT superfamily N-acetyltransferase